MEEVYSNLFCILILFVILFALLLQNNKNKDKKKKAFILIIVSALIYITSNLLSEAFEGNSNATLFLYVVNYISFVGIDLVVITFYNYFYSYIEHKRKIDKINKKAIIIGSIIRALLVLCLIFTGKFFTIENGCYTEHELIFVPYIISILIMIDIFGMVIVCRKFFTTRQFIIILIYQFMPILPIFLEIFLQTYTLVPMGISIAIILIYVFLQDTEIENNKLKTQILEELSSIDLLTNLKNRRSYYDYINNLQQNEDIGVIFSDINGLKYTNDHFGHTAGDELIKKYANMLVEFFDEDCVFRISGDEFVVVSKDPEIIFNNKVTYLREKILENNSIASIGVSFGKGCKVEMLVSESENKMYAEKAKNGLGRDSKITVD